MEPFDIASLPVWQDLEAGQRAPLIDLWNSARAQEPALTDALVRLREDWGAARDLPMLLQHCRDIVLQERGFVLAQVAAVIQHGNAPLAALHLLFCYERLVELRVLARVRPTEAPKASPFVYALQ